MRSKTYNKVKEQAPKEAVSMQEAVAFLKEHARASFDETIEVHVRLGINPAKSDQFVRGNVTLPSGSPKKKVIIAFTEDKDAKVAAKKAGADIVGGEDLIEDIQKNGVPQADVSVASPDMMPKIAKIARDLGPKGLMPNPKSGTVSPNVAQVIEELSAGKVSFKMDQQGNVHEAVGKVSWDIEKITDNIEAFLDAVRSARPDAAKGEFVRSVTLSTTMGPGIRIAR